MHVHARAPLSPIGRRRVVDRVCDEGWSVTAAAEAAGVSERSVYRWLARFREHGQPGLVDRPPVPRRVPGRTSAKRVRAICELRQLRLTGAEIAERLSMPLSTVSAVLRREGLGKRSRLAPPEPVNRYERARPGELVHIDVKKLGRIEGGPGKRILGRPGTRRSPRRTDAAGVRRAVVGWECVHVAVDDFSRLAFVEVLPDQTAMSAIGFLERARVVLRQPRHPRPAGDDRQRLGLRQSSPPDRLPATRRPPSADAGLPAAHKRQGVCLSVGVPSGGAARLPAPGGLTQA